LGYYVCFNILIKIISWTLRQAYQLDTDFYH
jgi:hypothetical protein